MVTRRVVKWMGKESESTNNNEKEWEERGGEGEQEEWSKKEN